MLSAVIKLAFFINHRLLGLIFKSYKFRTILFTLVDVLKREKREKKTLLNKNLNTQCHDAENMTLWTIISPSQAI